MEKRGRTLQADPGREALNDCQTKKKKSWERKRIKMAGIQRQRLGFAFCQGFIHLALASMLVFPSKWQLWKPGAATQVKLTQCLWVTLNFCAPGRHARNIRVLLLQYSIPGRLIAETALSSESAVTTGRPNPVAFWLTAHAEKTTLGSRQGKCSLSPNTKSQPCIISLSSQSTRIRDASDTRNTTNTFLPVGL